MDECSTSRAAQADDLTPEMVIQAYQLGFFPMAMDRDKPVQWYTADPRAIVPLDAFHLPRNLARTMRKQPYAITRDKAFAGVIRACQAPAANRPETWINDQIVSVYTQLHEMGAAHSVEAWSPDGQLVGGLYGVSIGGAFFGESMFSTQTNASKICLVHLVQHLNERGYHLLDAQIGNDHMKQFGQIEIPLDDYMLQLREALQLRVTW